MKFNIPNKIFWPCWIILAIIAIICLIYLEVKADQLPKVNNLKITKINDIIQTNIEDIYLLAQRNIRMALERQRRNSGADIEIIEGTEFCQENIIWLKCEKQYYIKSGSISRHMKIIYKHEFKPKMIIIEFIEMEDK